MANTEKRQPQKLVHFLLAFRRRKNNPDGPVMCFREIVSKDESVDLERLRVRVRTVPGVWRIHRTVNQRDTHKAARTLQHRLLDNPDDAESLVTVWKTCLLQKESRAGRDILVDVDDPEQLERVLLIVGGRLSRELTPTPSGGFHVVTQSMDTRPLEELPGVELQRDGYLFVEEITVPTNAKTPATEAASVEDLGS